MKDARLYKRIPCEGHGELVFDEEHLRVEAVNLSKGGVCLKMIEADWLRHGLDEKDRVSGRLTVDGDAFHFQARICWSTKVKKSMFFGIEFKEHDKHIIDGVLERLSVVDDLPVNDSFNL
jgi:c-di-GMP-binding flagellar brake protein YcgR